MESNESEPATPFSSERALAALGLTADALCDALLATLERSKLPLSIKEVASGSYLFVNQAYAALFGRSAAEIAGLADADLMEAGQSAGLRAAEQAAAASEVPQQTEHRLERAGARREFSVCRKRIAADAAAPGRRLVLAIWTELTEQRHTDAQLQRALQQIEADQRSRGGEAPAPENPIGNGLRDSETGLYPRAHFDDQLRREIDLSAREHREFALVSIMLDPRTEPVAALGAAARTRILEALGRLLRSNTRAMDTSCRLGDERFAVLLSGVGLATAHSRMEGLRRQCATQIVMFEGQELAFSVSMGVASFPHTATSQEELLGASETALAEARRRGGNVVTLASIRFDSA